MYEAGAGRTKIHVRSLWFLLMYASDLLDTIKSSDREKVHAGLFDADLLDALAGVLITDSERRMREALSAGYRPRSETMTRVRGRVDHLATARRRLMESGRVHCDFSELTFDRPRYRYLLVTLEKLQGHLTSATLRSRCMALAAQLERAGVTRCDPTRSELSREQYGFNDAKDRQIVNLCQLLRQFAVPEHTPGHADVPVITRDEQALRKLFETAVLNYYRFHLRPQGWTVESQQFKWHATGLDDDLRYLPRHETDAVLESADGRCIVIECKFAPIFDSSYGQPKLKQGYLRQLYSYSVAARMHKNLSQAPEGVLLAVRTEDGLGRDLNFSLGEYPIRVRLIELTGDISSIRQSLDDALN